MRQTEISGKWLCPNHIFELTIVGVPNRDGIARVFSTAEDFISQGTYPVYWINNLTAMNMPAIHVGSVVELARLMRHDNLHWGINYRHKNNRLLFSLAQIVEKSTGIRTYFAKDQADALRFIRERWDGFDDCIASDM